MMKWLDQRDKAEDMHSLGVAAEMTPISGRCGAHPLAVAQCMRRSNPSVTLRWYSHLFEGSERTSGPPRPTACGPR
jgi:hypothetical protein